MKRKRDLHRAAGTTLQPSVIRSKMVTVKGCGESWAGDTWATHLGFRNVKPSITVLDDPVHATHSQYTPACRRFSIFFQGGS